jgi:hypothetical protein
MYFDEGEKKGWLKFSMKERRKSRTLVVVLSKGRGRHLQAVSALAL